MEMQYFINPRQQPARVQPIFETEYINGSASVQLPNIVIVSSRLPFIRLSVTTAAYIPRSPPRDESPNLLPPEVI